MAPPTAAFERRVAGDALQLAGLVRDHGPETLHRLMDLWGPDHTRAVCIALAAAVDVDRTPHELWGWTGPLPARTVSDNELFNRSDAHSMTAQEIHDMRSAMDPRSKQQREYRRRRKESGSAA